MQLNNFEEKVHSVSVLIITLAGIIYFFLQRNFYFYLPVFLFLMGIYIANRVQWFFIFKVVLYSFIFSFFCAYFIVFFPSKELAAGPIVKVWLLEIPERLIWNQFNVFVRVGTISCVSLVSIFSLKFEKIMLYFMRQKTLAARLGYPLLLAFNSIALMRAEFEKIDINTKFRNLNWKHRLNLFFPLLVFAIRHADRGAMSLMTRGLTEDKSYFFDTNLHKKDYWIIYFFSAFIFLQLILSNCLFNK